MTDYGLKDKVVLITGANNPQGIGAHTAYSFAEQGAKIVLAYKREIRPYDPEKTGENGIDRYYRANGESAAQVEKQLCSLGAEVLILEQDISDEEAVRQIFQQAKSRFGRVDILVNNAAYDDENGCDTIRTLTTEAIDKTFAVNVRGMLLMSREFIRQCQGGGRIISLSTDAAQVFAGQITYGASKAAVEALTRSIALEAGSLGITVNCIAPGPTQTGWISREHEESIIPDIPLGRLVQPQDIADAVLFLAGEKAGMITGQVIKVSGGHAL